MKEAKELLFVVIEVPLVFKILWIILLSIVAYVAMFWDKLCAIKGWWRVSEANLLLWAFLGGAVGAKIGQRVFRHKTSKKPFKTYLNFALAANVLIFGVFSFFSVFSWA